MKNNHLKVIISGGGTGGHVFPAIAIGRALRKKFPESEILFVGAKGKLEMKKVPDAGFQIIGLNISGIHRRAIAKNFGFPFKLMSSLLKSRNIIKKFNPDVVVGVGGYASGPILYMAHMKKIPTLIQEQNSYPGITNRLLAKKVKKVCVAYEGLEEFFDKDKIVITGNPIRESFLGNNEMLKIRGLTKFQLDKNRKTLLVVGGSQGALSINKAILNNLIDLKECDWQVIWQTGKGFYQKAKESVEYLKCENIHVLEFIEEMNLAYAVADLVVSRAGAIAISELCVLGKASVLVPLGTAAGDHQRKNAAALKKKNAVLQYSDAKISENLMPLLKDFKKHPEKLEKLGNKILEFGKPEAVEHIVDEIVKLCESKW